MITSLCKIKRKSSLLTGQTLKGVKHEQYLNANLICTSPSVALGQAKEEILRMGLYTIEALESTHSFLLTRKKRLAMRAYEIEGMVNTTSLRVLEFLNQFTKTTLTMKLNEEQKLLLKLISIIKEITDHITSMLNQLELQLKKKIIFSKEALNDIQELSSYVMLTLREALKALDFKDSELASNVLHERENMKLKTEELVQNHLQRLKDHDCKGSASAIYFSLLEHLTGIRENAAKIGCALLNSSLK